MIPLDSTLENQSADYADVCKALEPLGFGLGGNWTYETGSFDLALDGEAQKVWLRLPFRVTNGRLDADNGDNEARVLFGQPFILKHLYNEGLDGEAVPRILGALIDQFQDPIDPDAKVETEWIDVAKQELRQVEKVLPH